jgi:hypothetical protein
VAHWTCAVLSIIAAFGVWLTLQIRKARRLAVANAPASEVEPVTFDDERTPFQYNLRSLMILVTLVAVICSIFSIGTHVGVFVSSVALSVFLTDLLWRKQRRTCPHGGRSGSKRGGRMLWAAVLASWFVVYVLSMGPVAAVTSPQCLNCRRDTRVVILRRVYAPATWLCFCRPIRLYFSAFDPDTFPREIDLIW